MRSPKTKTAPHGAHARTKAPAPPGRRGAAEPPRSARDATRRAAELAACESGLPATLPGGFRIERLSKNRRSGDTLYVYRKEGGGTFCANQKGVRTRLARLAAEAQREAELAPAPAPIPAPAPEPQTEPEVRSETPAYAAIAAPAEARAVADADAGWLRRYARPALIAAALVVGAAIVVRVAVALGA